MDKLKIQIAGNHVTKEEVDGAIKDVIYAKLGKKITVCHLTLWDGFEVIGYAGVVDEKLFNEEIGNSIALANAKDRVWQHMGSILQDRLLSEKE